MKCRLLIMQLMFLSNVAYPLTIINELPKDDNFTAKITFNFHTRTKLLKRGTEQYTLFKMAKNIEVAPNSVKEVTFERMPVWVQMYGKVGSVERSNEFDVLGLTLEQINKPEAQLILTKEAMGGLGYQLIAPRSRAEGDAKEQKESKERKEDKKESEKAEISPTAGSGMPAGAPGGPSFPESCCSNN